METRLGEVRLVDVVNSPLECLVVACRRLLLLSCPSHSDSRQLHRMFTSLNKCRLDEILPMSSRVDTDDSSAAGHHGDRGEYCRKYVGPRLDTPCTAKTSK